jgi:hypothetical protein
MIAPDRSFEVCQPAEHLVLLTLHTFKRRLETLHVFQQQALDVLGHVLP